VLGPTLFAAYIAPASRCIDAHSIHQHSYADDITLYLGLGADPLSSRSKLLGCVAEVGRWFTENDLQLNSSKSEVMEVGTTTQLRKSPPETTYSISDSIIQPVSYLKIVGVILDNKLNFDRFISATCSACAMHIRALKHIRPLLDNQTANSIACSMIASRLDYCNSLLAGITIHNIARLQRQQNSAARVVCCSGKRSNSGDLLRQLHWLPIEHRIKYKVASLTFNAILFRSPIYLSELLTVYDPIRELRSTGTFKLAVPRNKTNLAGRAFQNFAPRIWNDLPVNLRAMAFPESDPVGSPTVDRNESLNLIRNSFKRQLKTELFKSAFE
jgi:hypothetical protein